MNREAEFEQFLATHPQRLVDPMTRVDELLVYLNKAQARTETLLQREVSALESIATAGGITLPTGMAPQTVIHINPRALMEIIMGMADLIPGVVFTQFWQFAFTATNLATTNFSLITPAGWVYIFVEGLRLSSDFYDPNIFVTVMVNAELVTSGPVPLTAALEATAIKPFHEGDNILTSVLNGTVTDALVTMTGTAIGIEKSYYEKSYLPLLLKGYDKLIYTVGGV